MIRAYEELVDFIAGGPTAEAVARFEDSQESKDRVADLVHKQKTVGLTAEEASDLNHFLQLEHVVRLAKARAIELRQSDARWNAGAT